MKYGKDITELLNIIKIEADKGNIEAIDWLKEKGYIYINSLFESQFVYYNAQRRNLYANNFRNKILQRDNYKCKKCNKKEQLHIHHIKSWAEYPNERFNEKNCITLCIECHAEIHPNLKNLIKNKQCLIKQQI